MTEPLNNVQEGHKQKQSYSNTRKTGKEQYYTNPEVVDICLEMVAKHIDLTGKTIIEPCGGTGEFIKGLVRAGISENQIISYDIEPKHPLVKEGNYLETKWESEEQSFISITNPPFGRASSLAKKFFNHDAGHCDYICYLVPKSWRKWSLHNSLDSKFHLIADIELPKNCFYRPNEEKSKKDVLNTVFQIWERRDHDRPEIKIPDHGLVEKVQPVPKITKRELVKDSKGNVKEKLTKRPDYVEGANFQMIVFGHSCGKTSEITEPRVDAKTTTMYFKIEKEEVKQALREIDFSKYFKNVAYVEALSLQEINYELNAYFGLPNFSFDNGS